MGENDAKSEFLEMDSQQPPSQAETDLEDTESDTSTVDESSDNDENEASIASTESTEQKDTPSSYNIAGVRNDKEDDSDQSEETKRQNKLPRRKRWGTNPKEIRGNHCNSSFKERPTACAARDRTFRVTRSFLGSSSLSN